MAKLAIVFLQPIGFLLTWKTEYSKDPKKVKKVIQVFFIPLI